MEEIKEESKVEKPQQQEKILTSKEEQKGDIV